MRLVSRVYTIAIILCQNPVFFLKILNLPITFFPQVPIKWMALESILNRTYTHQSDVWSYGKYCIYLCVNHTQ